MMPYHSYAQRERVDCENRDTDAENTEINSTQRLL